MGFVVVSPRYELARKRICIVISSAQNLRANERANERALFSQDDDNFSSRVVHTRVYASFTVYFRASICPGFISCPVLRATRSSLIAAGRLFPAHERAISSAIPASDRNIHSSQTLFGVKRLHTQSETNRIESDFNTKRNCVGRFISTFKY